MMRDVIAAYRRPSTRGFRVSTWCAVVLLCSLAVVVLRPDKALAVSPNSPENFARIAADLAANKPAQTADAILRIKVLVKHFPYQCDWRLAVNWLPVLLARGQYPAVADLAVGDCADWPFG